MHTYMGYLKEAPSLKRQIYRHIPGKTNKLKSDIVMEISVPMGVRKGAWSTEEDELLKKCIEKHGIGKWHQVPSRAGLNRCRKSCRLRWLNYLRPNIKRGDFSSDEVDLIIRLHTLLGNRWSLIAGRLPGRTSNDIKNYWNTHLLKKDSSERLKHSDISISKKMLTKVFRPQPRTFSKSSLLMSKTFKSNTTVQIDDNTSDPSLASKEVDPGKSWWENMLDNNIENPFSFSFDNSTEETIKDDWVSKVSCNSQVKVGSTSVHEGQLNDWSDIFTKNVDYWDIFFDDQKC